MKLHEVAGLFLVFGLLPMSAHAAGRTSHRTIEKDFQWYCESSEATAEQKKTVRAIYDRVPRLTADTTCEQAMVVLKMVPLLDLKGKALSDLSPLAGMTTLSSIDLEDNNLTSLGTLPELPRIQGLNLRSNSLQEMPDFSPFPALFSLTLDDNPLKSVDKVEGIKNIRFLFLYDVPISDLSFLGQLNQLEALGVGGNEEPSTLDTMPTMPKLRFFGAYKLGLDKISFADKIPNVDFLSVSSNKISDLQPLKELPKLRAIDLTRNSFTEIPEGFFGEEIELLGIGGNPISDFEFLRSIKKLKMGLSVRESQFKEWDQIAHLVPLIEDTLDLTDSEISQIIEPKEMFQEWPTLMQLYLAGTKITSLAVFKKISIPNLNKFTGPDIKNKTEENCPTHGVPHLIAKFCAK